MTETAVPTIIPTPVGRIDLARLHFVGIGGVGMAPLAKVCALRGLSVSGSDQQESQALAMLGLLGVGVHAQHHARNVPADATAVVITHAIDASNVEVQAAQLRDIPVVHRSSVLNALLRGQTSIGVLGTHGKTTTAAMIACTLNRLEEEPSYVFGGAVSGPLSGGADGRGRVFVAEIDESDRTHTAVSVNVAVICDIEHDHVENYASVGEHIDAYEDFVRGMRPDGLVVLNIDSPAVRELASRLALWEEGPRVVSVGFASGATWRIEGAACHGGRSTARLSGTGGVEWPLVLPVPGLHQLRNAALTVAVLNALGSHASDVVEQLREFEGVRRRMSLACEDRGVRVYDSYAHHPTEVRADLAAAQSVASAGQVIAVFQAPGATRVEAFGAQFGEALAGADAVVLTDAVRPLGEEALVGLAAQVAACGGTLLAVEVERAAAVARAYEMAQMGDVVVLMGTGDLVAHGRELAPSQPAAEPVDAVA
ncbi:UDP-N-acetylmuramate--L-alanine ligase [Streptomyces sp. NPDC006703]|uniref:UDP-N-acetylmuramate--L-alanine ligase n=1 Tax=Streptomyces sp. NPDC006703 TaxID=3364759 RepID=UPI0036B72A0B